MMSLVGGSSKVRALGASLLGHLGRGGFFWRRELNYLYTVPLFQKKSYSRIQSLSHIPTKQVIIDYGN